MIKPWWLSFTAIAVALMASPGNADAAWKETVLASFKLTRNGDPTKGGSAPSGNIVFDQAGNLYGVTVAGGAFGNGTVFRLSPSAGQTTWTKTILYSFTGGDDGYNPLGGLILDKAGNLYGTTSGGGPKDGGVVFRLTPPAAGNTAWTETVIFPFDGPNGSGPSASLVFDAAGNLYGTTFQAGPTLAGGDGNAFRLTPPATGNSAWTETLHFSFDGHDGLGPESSLIFDASGNLYGTTTAGGQTGNGTVFKLSPPAAGASRWTRTTLLNFNGTDGSSHHAGLVFDAAGNLYGAASKGGAFGNGAVLKLTKPAPGKTVWTETLLFSFDGTNGANPMATPIFDAAGALYGATAAGGASGEGTVFKLTPPTAGKTAWTETVLASFKGARGSFPQSSLIFDAAGNLYGATEGGLIGTVFKLAPQ